MNVNGDLVAYLMEVRGVFGDGSQQFVTLLKLLRDKAHRRIDFAEIIARAKELFKGHKALILGLNPFLPEDFKITLDDVGDEKKTTGYEEVVDFVNEIRLRFRSDERVYESFIEVLNLYAKKRETVSGVYDRVACLFKNHPDLLVKFSTFISDSEIPQNCFRGFDEQRTSVFANWQQNSMDFGVNSGIVSRDAEEALKRVYNQGLNFCEKFKSLCGLVNYVELLKYLHSCSIGIVQREDLRGWVLGLIGQNPDLVDEFNKFLESCNNINGFHDGVVSKKRRCSEKYSSRTVKAKNKEKEPEYMREGAKDKYMDKSIQELDLSRCKRCGPSYRLLPEDYPISIGRERTKLDAQVLNDHWACVPAGNKDFSCKHRHKNQYQEILFRCEDDQFELDMLIESVNSAAKSVEVLLNSINENKINLVTKFIIEDHLRVLNLRYIERLYDDHGAEAMDALRESPASALPVILTRLKQKQKELKKGRSDQNKVWAKVYAKNYHKSISPQSNCFKQQDSKSSRKNSVAVEVKEMEESLQTGDVEQKEEMEGKMQQDDDVWKEEMEEKLKKEDDEHLATDAGSNERIVPNLQNKYYDIKMHEDPYKLVSCSC